VNYWTNYLFKDKNFLAKLLIPGIGFLLLLDILSYVFNSPGYFNLWPSKIFAVTGIPIIIRIIYKNFDSLNKIKKTEREAPVYEKEREQEIREIIRNNPDFTTFCYECIYFNEEKKACRRDRVYERVKEISIGQRKYCLYWEEDRSSPDSIEG